VTPADVQAFVDFANGLQNLVLSMVPATASRTLVDALFGRWWPIVQLLFPNGVGNVGYAASAAARLTLVGLVASGLAKLPVGTLQDRALATQRIPFVTVEGL
jgi:hypothetical protein